LGGAAVEIVGLILPTGQITRCCFQPLLQKYSSSHLTQITCVLPAAPSHMMVVVARYFIRILTDNATDIP
jgi:hypothetical protein